MRKKHGFTLVELLVVIGIIAVLISILLPSLARARQYANNLLCMANLRSVGQGLLLYANDHKGKLPYSGNDQWGDIWPGQVTAYLGGQLTKQADPNPYGNVNGNYAAVLRCPDAPPETISASWNNGFHYTANCRAMPWYYEDSDTLKNIGNPTPKVKSQPYPLATKDAAAKCLLWDGPLFPGFGWNAATSNRPQCWSFLTWGYDPAPSWVNYWADPSPGFTHWDETVPPAQDSSYNSPNVGDPHWVGKVNVDAADTERPWDVQAVGFQRYRHLGNTSGNFLYFDGHVESKKVGELHYRDISIYPF